MSVVFPEHPWVAFIVAAAFFALARWTARRSIVAVAALWAGYGCYEFAMYERWLCTGECNIRVDLLLIYPVLAVASLAGVAIGGIAAYRRVSAARSS